MKKILTIFATIISGVVAIGAPLPVFAQMDPNLSTTCNITTYVGQPETFQFATDVENPGYMEADYFLMWANQDGFGADGAQVNDWSANTTGSYSLTDGSTYTLGNGFTYVNQNGWLVPWKYASITYTWSTPGNYVVEGYIMASHSYGAPTNAGTNPPQNDIMLHGNDSDSSTNAPAGCKVTVIQKLPDLVPGSTPNVSATTGQPVTLQSSVTNNGNADAGSFTNTFSTSDGQSVSSSVGSLGVGASTNVSGTFTFNSPGTYTYNYCVDSGNNITESSESNNCSSGSIYVSNPPTPDLGAGTISSVSGIVGQPVTMSIPITNYGNADANGFPVLFWSNDGSLFADSSYISVPQGQSTTAYLTNTWSNPGTYTVNACANRNTSWGLVVSDSNTANDCSGSTNVTIYAVPAASMSLSTNSVPYGGSSTLSWSCTNGATSCTGTNFDTGGQMSGSITINPTTSTTYTVWSSGPGGSNSASQTLNVGQPYPDVTASADAPVTTVLGNSFNVTGTIYNIGAAPMNGPFNVMTQVCDGNGGCGNYNYTTDTQLGTLNNGSSQGVTLSVPPTPGAGSYSYRICADTDRNWNQPNNESNEGNNCSGWQTINTIAADLTASDISPTSGIVGNPVTFSATAYNNGNATSGSFPILFQIQNGDIFDSGYVGGIGPGGNVTGSASYTFSNPGTYQVRACVNRNTSWQAITPDSNYNNDCGNWDTVTIYPVPTASLSLSPNSVPYGGSSTLSWSCANGATSCAGTNFNTNGQLSGSVTVSATQNTTYTVYSNGPGGTTSASQTLSVGQPYPDLTATVGSSVTALTNTTFALGGTVSNIGNAGTPGSFPSAIQICDSNCATYNRLISGQTSQLGVGASVSFTLNTSISNAGNYYYRVCADNDGSWNSSVAESNEGNNCSNWQNLTINAPTYPDLTVGAPANVTATLGQPITLNGTVYNNGNATAYSFNNIFATNLNSAQNGWNTVVAAQTISSLSPGNSAPIAVTLPASTFTTAGSYAYAYCADLNTSWAGSVTESNENNNCSSWATITVQNPAQPDLVPGAAPTVTATLGNDVPMAGVVTNSGNADTGATFQNLFKTNQTSSGWNTVVGASQAGPLAAGQSQNITATFPAATFSAPGSYAYQYCVDQDVNNSWNGSITESNESNNCSAMGDIEIQEPQILPDFTESSVIPAGGADATAMIVGKANTLVSTTTNQQTSYQNRDYSFPVRFFSDKPVQYYNGSSWVTGTSWIANNNNYATIYNGEFSTRANGVANKVIFPQTGTYNIHACANQDSLGVNIVSESAYNNDCSADTTFTVVNDTCRTFYATPSTLTNPGLVSITWAGNGDSNNQCTGQGFSTGGAGSGTVSLNQNTTTTYGLSCTYNYSDGTSGSCNANLTVPVSSGICTGGGASLSLVANPSRLIAGSSSKLSWSATNTIDSCTLTSSDGTVLDSGTPAQCSAVVSGNNIKTGPITTQTVYTLTCGSGVTKTTKQVVVNVVPKFGEF